MSELFDLTRLKTKYRNPRKIGAAELDRLKASVTGFSKMLALRPIVYDPGTMEVLGGNQRLRALLETGLVEVPHEWVKSVEDFTEEEKKRFVITDNTTFGEWDEEILSEDYSYQELEDWAANVGDLEDWIDSQKKLEAKEDDYTPPNSIETDIKPGDFFEIGEHRLVCGDSTKPETFERLFEGGFLAKCVNTDPPYNVNYKGAGSGLTIANDNMGDEDFFRFLNDFYKSLNAFVMPGGAWYIWHADSEGATFRLALKGTGILFKQVLIWVKNQFTLGRQDYQWKHEPCIHGVNENDFPEDLTTYDPCLYGWKEGAKHHWYADRRQSTILEFKKPLASHEHPTMKPVELIGYQIGNSTLMGDVVADGFGGSGTAMVACEQLKRRCFMVEYSPEFCQVIIDRMQKLVPGIKIFKNGNPYEQENNH